MLRRFMLTVALVCAALVSPRHAHAADRLDAAMRVPMVQTPIDRRELARVLLRAHRTEFGAAPSLNRLSMAWAQVALENGYGKYSYGHNLGNIGPSARDQPWYFSRLDGNQYRAFESFEAAARAYWQTVRACGPRFDAGDALGAAHCLKLRNYFGADEGKYGRAMAALFWQARRVDAAEALADPRYAGGGEAQEGERARDDDRKDASAE